MARAGTVYTIFNADLSRYSRHRPSILNWIVTSDASFGEIGMADRTFRILTSRNGDEAAVNGATQIRAGVMRPEVMVPWPLKSGPATTDKTDAGGAMQVGLTVRIVRDPYFGRIGEVSSNDPTAYLPTSAQATQVQARLPEFLGGDTIPAVVLVTAGSPLTAAQKAQLDQVPTALAGIQGVSGRPSPPIVSQDGTAAQVFVPVAASAPAEAQRTIKLLDGRVVSETLLAA